MAKVEVDESVFIAQRELAALHQQMMNNPRSRELLTKAAKTVNPNIITAENDAKEEIRGEVKVVDDRIAALETKIAADAAARELETRQREFVDSWNARKGSLRQQGYTEEGVTAIEKFAEERGLVDLDAAAALFDKMHPPATIAQPGGGYGGLDQFQASAADDENFKKLLESEGKDPAAERAMINQALTDHRSGKY